MIAVKYTDLSEALEFVSSGVLTENSAYISKQSGRIYWVSAPDPIEEDVPDDIEQSDAYIPVPHKHDLDLGRDLAFRFTKQALPDRYDTVRNFFGHRGAYRRFKTFLEASGLLESWYAFEAEATRQVLADWCEANGIELIFDERQA